MYKKIILPLILIIVFLSSIIFLIGIKESIKLSVIKEKPIIRISDSEVLSSVKKSDKYTILMLGDSIGLGFGDESGLDIGNYYKSIQTQYDKENIETVNLAVNGAKIKDLLNQIQKQEISELIKHSELIIISIGGNDMKKILDSSNLNLLIDYQELAQMYEWNLKEILDNIKNLNSKVKIAMIGLYNPYGEDIPKEKIQILINWNHLTRSIIENYSEVAYVGTYDLFKYNLDKYLAIDVFHPNALGYRTISSELLLVIDGIEE
ncbi:GDSL-type esterase/lipase family protein [Clostridiaceae bacterium HSG29]|nr:GDSL-type esterase/lipase family protein [Clostridiaceae bacterium HSG29]